MESNKNYTKELTKGSSFNNFETKFVLFDNGKHGGGE